MDKHTKLQQPSLYEKGVTPDFNTKIIDKNSSCIVASRLNRKGSIAKDNFKLQISRFWIPEEVDLSDDKKQWQSLPKDVKYVTQAILSYINFLDSKMSLMPTDISRYLSLNEFHLPIAFQQGMEALHTHTYSYIYEEIMSLDEEQETAKMFYKDPILEARIWEVVKYNSALAKDPTLHNLCRAILSIYILEGIYFFNGFNFFYFLENKGILKGVAKLISTINRDEVSHLMLFKEIISVMKEDGMWVLSDAEVFEQFESASNVEITFSRSIFSDKFVQFSENNITKFVYYLANKRLKFIGYKTNPYNQYKTNPYKIFSRFEPDEADGQGVQHKETNPLIGKTMDYARVNEGDMDW